ncbi:trypsin-like serine protease [Vibrio harveyi]|uniref:trypsin-like serine protease n=2 Tax=Vibrio harveyi TaxID=669 RepID=UPI00215D3C8C|nr:trypsin-like serine protease [Vibrio harveyi]MCR9772926.1 trypsin-like serine protease [Vibrio harveyi]
MNLSKTLLATALLPMLASADQVTQTQYDEIQPDIVGGITATPNDWKFYTQIVSRNSNRSFCGASYIGDGYVLTAAHCVDGDAPNQIAVKIGGVIYNGTDGVRSNVSQIYVHPSYNRSTLSHDIALLKLSSKPQGVTKVDIASGSVSQYAGVGDWLTVAGLGRTSEGGSSPAALQEVDVPLVSDAMCRQAGGNYTTVGAVSFCAGVPQGGIDSCQGDSGGPIVVNNNGVVTQLGIVSWGIGCARPGKYGVYSDIAALRSFVDGVLGTTMPPTDNVSVGYTANQTLSSFKVGELKQHSFSIQNIGNVAFTVESVELQSSGVTKSAMITRDQCAQSTLSARSSCVVDVEFGASQAGDASVTLNFGIDKTSTSYQAVVIASAVSSTTPPSGSCENEWQVSAVYNTGETVSWAGQIWQAQWWTQGDNPSESGLWGVWQAVGASDCTGTTPPVEPPTDPTPPTKPTPPSSGDAYQAGTNYTAGDVVTNRGASYQCKPWPNTLWCGSTPSAYEPGIGYAWTDAWLKL